MKIIAYIKNNLALFLYFAFSIFSVKPLLSPGFFPIHDDTQIARVFEMAKSLSHGMFPVRWVQDLGYGYGYPIFNFYSVLPYYIGGIFTNLGFDALLTTKILFMLILIGSGASMYLLVKEIFGKQAAFVSAVIYLYFPYHAVNVYVRGDLAEATAYGFLPLVFLSLFKIHESTRISKKYITLGSIAIAAVILSHNLSFFILGIFIGLFILASLIVSKTRKNLLISYLLVLGLAFLLSAFYTLPAIFEMKYTNIASIVGGGADVRDHFVCVTQLWDSPWGFGGSAPGCVDGMSFKLGKLNIILLAAAFILFALKRIKDKEKLFVVSVSFAGFLFSIFMLLPISAFVWGLPFMDFLQFPWRFLNFSGLFISVLVGFLVWQLRKSVKDKILIFIGLLIATLTLLYNAVLFNPMTIHDRNSLFYTNEPYLKWDVSKISDEYLPRTFTKPKSDKDFAKDSFNLVSGNGNVEILLNKTQEKKVRLDLSEESTVRVNIAYFPAWKIFVNNKESFYIIKDDGLYLDLPSGQYVVNARFVQTPIEKISNALSLIGLLGIIIVIIPYGKKTS